MARRNCRLVNQDNLTPIDKRLMGMGIDAGVLIKGQKIAAEIRPSLINMEILLFLQWFKQRIILALHGGSIKFTIDKF